MEDFRAVRVLDALVAAAAVLLRAGAGLVPLLVSRGPLVSELGEEVAKS